MQIRSRFFLSAGALLFALSACSPTLNWREVRVNSAPLLALFPCRPDEGVQAVTLGGQTVKMSMMGCEAGGVMFTLAHVDPSGSDPNDALVAAWQAGTLASMQGAQTRQAPFSLKKADTVPAPRHIRAVGKRADGSAVVLRAAWFAAGGVVYQAAVYSDRDNEAVVQTYFDGIRVP